MPYVPIELDAMKAWPMIAQGLKIERAFVAQGFCDLWQSVYQRSLDVVSLLHLECMFTAPGERVAAVLCEFGFLQAQADGLYRVRGAQRRIEAMRAKADAGSKGGLATAAAGRSSDNLLKSSRRNPKGSKEGSRKEAPKEAEMEAERKLSSKDQRPKTKDQSSNPSEKARKAEEPAAPGYRELVAGLHAAFEEARGTAPNPLGKDWGALKKLRARVSNNDPEILARWKRGLRGQFKERVDSFWDLNTRWDALTGTGPPAAIRDFSKGRVGAEEIPKENHKKTGTLDGF